MRIKSNSDLQILRTWSNILQILKKIGIQNHETSSISLKCKENIQSLSSTYLLLLTGKNLYIFTKNMVLNNRVITRQLKNKDFKLYPFCSFEFSIRTGIRNSSPVWCGWIRVLHPFDSISVISRWWKGEHERLCAMKRRLGSGRISPPAGFEPVTPWSEVGSANRSAMRTLRSPVWDSK